MFYVIFEIIIVMVEFGQQLQLVHSWLQLEDIVAQHLKLPGEYAQ